MSTTNNPIRDCYEALFAALAAKTDFAAMFPTGTPHIVKYNTSLSYAPEPDLDECAPADYPRCRITLREFQPQNQMNSSGTELTLVFQLEIATGEQYQSDAMDALWPVLRASTTWHTYLRNVVQWNSLPCVMWAELGQGAFESPNDRQGWHASSMNSTINRGTEQWIAVAHWIVKLEFATADLQTY